MNDIYTPKRILSYVVASDNGLAPNITDGICTLTVCKPVIRRVAQTGEDYIVGLSTAKDGREKVIYVMQVDEKMTYDEYFDDPRFQNKKPNVSFKGDNFFQSTNNGLKVAFKEAAHFGKADKIKTDLNAPVAVIGKTFWYFGDNAPKLPKSLSNSILTLPDKFRRGHRVVKSEKDMNKFISWLSKYPPGVYGEPRDLKKKASRNIRTRS